MDDDTPYRSMPYRAETVKKPVRTWRRGLSNLTAGLIMITTTAVLIDMVVRHPNGDDTSGRVMAVALYILGGVGATAFVVREEKYDKWLMARRNIGVIVAAAWPLSLVIACVWGFVRAAMWLVRLAARSVRTFVRWIRYGDAPRTSSDVDDSAAGV